MNMQERKQQRDGDTERETDRKKKRKDLKRFSYIGMFIKERDQRRTDKVKERVMKIELKRD